MQRHGIYVKNLFTYPIDFILDTTRIYKLFNANIYLFINIYIFFNLVKFIKFHFKIYPTLFGFRTINTFYIYAKCVIFSPRRVRLSTEEIRIICPSISNRYTYVSLYIVSIRRLVPLFPVVRFSLHLYIIHKYICESHPWSFINCRMNLGLPPRFLTSTFPSIIIGFDYP